MLHLRLKILEEVVFAPKQLSLDQEETLKGLKAGINVDATELCIVPSLQTNVHIQSWLDIKAEHMELVSHR